VASAYDAAVTVAYLVVAILASAIVVFAAQNGTPVAVRFLGWTLPATSLAALVLVALAGGLVVEGIPLWIQRWRLGAQVRVLKVQVRQLETALAERDRALLAQRPSSDPR
jgi:uncharacterized integral membrane protein